MYGARMRTLTKAYRSAERGNAVYTSALQEQVLQEQQLNFLVGLQEQLKTLDLGITSEESKWREAILSILENEIVTDLTYVFPDDGYNIKLSTRVLRNKIHIEARVSSVFTGDIPGKIRGTQGRIFQQVVSFSSIIGVMDLLGIKTVYVDEAFSGSSKRNIRKVNALLDALRKRGFNLAMIAQDTSMADGIPANRLFLQRSLDNQTTITQEVGAIDGV